MMNWLNEPDHWRSGETGISLCTDPRTDFWRKTHDGGIRDNGHFYSETVAGDFTATVKIVGNYQSQYDQAGLMVRLDEATWLKCGIEFVDAQQFASAVVTRDFSDWSIVPLSSPTSVWIQCARQGSTFAVHYSLTGSDYVLLRQAFLTDAAELKVGMMAAAPKGEGLEVVFEDYRVTT